MKGQLSSLSLPPLPRSWWVIGIALVMVVAWDISGWDLPVAQWMGTPSGFPLQDNYWLSQFFHARARQACLVLGFALALGIPWPWGFLRSLTPKERVWLFLTILACALSISVMKRLSQTSCPWDLALFGGAAPYISHWQWGLADGGPGHCFPAGHASSAFAFFPIVWVVAARSAAPRTAWLWLLVVLAAGMGLGLVQQWRGAHFMSHTLWSAWVCAGVSFASWQWIGQRLAPLL